MTEKDMKECYFIDDHMKFYTYKDFLLNCEIIKRMYEEQLSKYGKLFFKWYLYANIDLTIGQKNKAWDYLNGYSTKDDLYE